MADQSRLTWALIVSVLLHGLLLSLLPILRRAHIEIPAPPPLLDVDVVPLPKVQAPPPPAAAAPAAPAVPAPPLVVPKQQIVSQPEEGEEKEPENARFLSDRNNTVKEEKVHHAEPAAGSPESKHEAPPKQEANAKNAHAAAPPKEQAEHAERPRPNTQVASLPKLDQLLPPAGDLIREGLVQPQTQAPAAPPAAAAPEQHASIERNDLLRHGDPWKTNGVRGGSMDFLPQVREGDVTMLNTKAEQFAPFVRRVAIRVFENFSIALRRSVYNSLQGSTQESAVIEAIMDKKGQLLRIEVKDRSTSIVLGTDRILQGACHEGCFDRNPPPGAESNDGNIHFLFEVQIAVSIDPGRHGPVGGWMMGAGLL
jgi:hypothetical protein